MPDNATKGSRRNCPCTSWAVPPYALRTLYSKKTGSHSFLVKDLLIDWRWGERHFMQQLVDGDPAANNGGWQWTAGTGTDAAPYFRIFNPVLQGKHHDPQGTYIRRWVPELAGVPDRYIHAPWEMDAETQKASGCLVGKDYPTPIVDHRQARERTLVAYRSAREE